MVKLPFINSNQQKAGYLSLFSTVLLSTFYMSCYADDTEIYFNDKQTTIKPNVLFILDRSLSMDKDPEGKTIKKDENQDLKTLSKLNLLKESFQLIFSDPTISGLRIGVMDYGSGKPNLAKEVIDVDAIDETRNIENLNQQINGDEITFEQPIWQSTDDGYQNKSTQNNWLDFTIGGLLITNTTTTGRYFAYRFDNILLKSKKDREDSGYTNSDYGVKSAKLSLNFYGAAASTTQRQLDVYIDPKVDSIYLRPRTKNDISSRFLAANNANNANLGSHKIQCAIDSYKSGTYTCDVTKLVRTQLAKNDWQDGYAMTFIIVNSSYRASNPSIARDGGSLSFKERGDQYQAKLIITANKNVIAKNKRTRKETLIDTAFALKTSGATYTNRAIFAASQYISNISGSRNPGPFHSDNAYSLSSKSISTASPLVAGCQLTHFILMSDGQPTNNYYATIRDYMGQKKSCTINGVEERYGDTNERCGRALTNWLAQTSQSSFAGPNYIWTHTIGFGMVSDNDDEASDDVQFGPDSNPVKYLRDLASNGNGQFHTAKDIDGLVDAFKSIINEALSVNVSAVSGQVVTSSVDFLEQRREAFYSIYQSQLQDYWPGNLKGFKMVYNKEMVDGKLIEIPVLYSWDEEQKAINSDGQFKSGVDSAWSEGMGDGGNVKAGGVVAQLPEQDELPNRPLFTFVGGAPVAINSSANLSTQDLDLASDEDDVKKGLLDFMRGYVYQAGGSNSAAGKKIGDSIAAGVSMVSYGCTKSGADITTCGFDDLNLVGLLASNDGVLRSYDLKTGKALYEFMPKEMLPIIKHLQKPATLMEQIKDEKNNLLSTKKVVKTYGLDGKVIIYHEPSNKENKDGFIRAGDKAYAFLAAGRGGGYIYAFDISYENRKKFKPMWTLTSSDLSNLGAAWSEPIVGKVKIGGTVTPVVIFGAGNQDPQSKNLKGNGVYMVDAKTGTIIWGSNNMTYSVPGGVTAYVDSDNNPDGLISDIFFGDLGGQLWRFHINNGQSISGLVSPAGNSNGVVASIGSTRYFYQKPVIYDLSNAKNVIKDMISINIGTGYKEHPLVQNTQDRFYSFRFPKDYKSTNNIVTTESDLAELTLDTKGTTYVKNYQSITKGFMVVLDSQVGEKVISNAAVFADRLVFNTYIPDNTFNPKTCIPNTGKQRSYSVNVVTGKNLLKDKYIETSISTIPNDVTVYCGSSFCSLVTGTNMLDGDSSKYEGRCENGVCEFPFTDSKPAKGVYIKTGWTDLFSL